MSEIKILKNGPADYQACINRIEDKFKELNSLEAGLIKKLEAKDWQGNTRDKCETMLNLTVEYKKKIKEILYEMNQKEQELLKNVNNFTTNSNAVKAL
ncbi:hypothetical protein [Clostridium sp. KNHs205]|jgi:hypothetical protein|uniref:hypothetical protein n=1 Tax=Clostridium sp. KNHs205 TaxID=1449050 RepID=UPI00051B0341|nr:hypothetical protein [Clostridium sp. KNHs205]